MKEEKSICKFSELNVSGTKLQNVELAYREYLWKELMWNIIFLGIGGLLLTVSY